MPFHYVYISTNKYRSAFYIVVTNNLKLRLHQNKENKRKTFASKYNIEFLVYYEKLAWIDEAIAREKELKKWNRDKKLILSKGQNPIFEFLNYHFE
ncbi:MAG: GIY-YIG nuclease family protein [Flavobacterium sp.]